MINLYIPWPVRRARWRAISAAVITGIVSAGCGAASTAHTTVAARTSASAATAPPSTTSATLQTTATVTTNRPAPTQSSSSFVAGTLTGCDLLRASDVQQLASGATHLTGGTQHIGDVILIGCSYRNSGNVTVELSCSILPGASAAAVAFRSAEHRNGSQDAPISGVGSRAFQYPKPRVTTGDIAQVGWLRANAMCVVSEASTATVPASGDASLVELARLVDSRLSRGVYPAG